VAGRLGDGVVFQAPRRRLRPQPRGLVEPGPGVEERCGLARWQRHQGWVAGEGRTLKLGDGATGRRAGAAGRSAEKAIFDRGQEIDELERLRQITDRSDVGSPLPSIGGSRHHDRRELQLPLL
jgi:hypothetical protein